MLDYPLKKDLSGYLNPFLKRIKYTRLLVSIFLLSINGLERNLYDLKYKKRKKQFDEDDAYYGFFFSLAICQLTIITQCFTTLFRQDA